MNGDQPLQLVVRDLGVEPYEKTWQLQQDLVDQRIADEIPDQLLLVEHDPAVVTIGRRSDDSQWKNASIPCIEVKRGGGPTYHGKGQLVAYPILKLSPGRPKLRDVLCLLEKTTIQSLAQFGLQAGLREGLTGVWLDERKIASIGIAAKRWVTYHGIAINVNPDMTPFFQIQPCGLSGDVMTSLALEALNGKPELKNVTVADLKSHFVEQFSSHFGYDETLSYS